MNVEVDNAPWKVIEFMHVKPGKGSAFVRSKLKNYLTKSTNEKTFRAGEKLQTADVEKRTMQYTYKDGEQFVMMDMETYEARGNARVPRTRWRSGSLKTPRFT